MLNGFKLSNGRPWAGLFGLALTGLVLMASAGSTWAAPSKGEVLAPSSLPYGYSYEEWSAKWWQYFLAQDTNKLAAAHSSGFCEGPASSVVFLQGTPSTETKTNHVTVTTENPIFLTVLGFVADNTACPVSDFGSLTGDQLAAEVVGGWDTVTATSCTIDGVEVPGLTDPTNSIYNVVSPAFSYTVAEKGNMLGIVESEDCIPGGTTIYPAVADGVYLMISPFKAGKHVIHFIASAPSISVNITEDITVLGFEP